jgi:uncharacterized protein YqhQ
MLFRQLRRFWMHTQLLPILESGEETLVGGQAVMEGVMMRAPHSYCVAVRRADGELVTEEAPLAKVSDRMPIFRLPVLRGLGTLGQAMSLGYKALKFSTDVAMQEEAKKESAANPGSKPMTEVPAWMMWMNVILSVGFFIVAYKLIPLYATEYASRSLPALKNAILFNLFDGVLRILIFLGFLWGLSRSREIHRVFQYHGAEHKVVFNFESGRDVSVPNAQSFVTFHPRCGTSFLMVIMLISMVTYMFLPFQSMQGRFLSRIVLIPVIAGVSYEIIRFAARRRGGLMTLLTLPGLWLQRITTQEPDDQQAAVAIHALEGAMKLEKEQGGTLVIA